MLMVVVTIKREKFPHTIEAIKQFLPLWAAHGIEESGEPMQLDLPRYYKIEKEKRLIWLVARDPMGNPTGYACHYWYRSLHYNERIGHDDLWYVLPQYRKTGLGTELHELGLRYLKEAGAVKTYEIMRGQEHSKLMGKLGYESWGIRWVKEL